MNRILPSFTAVLLLLFFFSCNGQQETAVNKEEKETPPKENANAITAADIPVLDFAQFEPYLSTESDSTFIINFWATWCKPCVEELPYFEEYYKKHKNEKMKMVLVSMDLPKQIEKKLVPFINNRNLEPEVVLLDAPDPNSWIDKVDPKWSGAIPITIIYNKDKWGFFEQSFHSLEELEETVANVLK